MLTEQQLKEVSDRCDAATHGPTDIPALLAHIEHQRRALECLAVSIRIALGDIGDAAYFNAILVMNEAFNATRESTSFANSPKNKLND